MSHWKQSTWPISYSRIKVTVRVNVSRKRFKSPLLKSILYEGADRVRGRGEKRGREGEKRWREEGEEGVGGGRRGGGRRERGGKKGGRGKEENFARAKRAPLQRGGGRRGGGRGEVRGREGGEAYPPVHPLLYP